MKITMQERAETMLRQQGERLSRARVAVLAALLSETGALSHAELEQRLPCDPKMDRVTLYRTLTWLEERAFVHKVTGLDRATLYRANAVQNAHHHPHFQCVECKKVICLKTAANPPSVPLPKGYRGMEMELTVKGVCPHCV